MPHGTSIPATFGPADDSAFPLGSPVTPPPQNTAPVTQAAPPGAPDPSFFAKLNPMNMAGNETGTQVAWHVAGLIITALVVVFVLDRTGFRFVVAAGRG